MHRWIAIAIGVIMGTAVPGPLRDGLKAFISSLIVTTESHLSNALSVFPFNTSHVVTSVVAFLFVPWFLTIVAESVRSKLRSQLILALVLLLVGVCSFGLVDEGSGPFIIGSLTVAVLLLIIPWQLGATIALGVVTAVTSVWVSELVIHRTWVADTAGRMQNLAGVSTPVWVLILGGVGLLFTVLTVQLLLGIRDNAQ